MTTTKDGVYQCKKHGSAGEQLNIIYRPVAVAVAETHVISMQPVLRLEETDHKGEGGCQESGQKIGV